MGHFKVIIEGAEGVLEGDAMDEKLGAFKSNWQS
jgi:hypothetical protein